LDDKGRVPYTGALAQTSSRFIMRFDPDSGLAHRRPEALIIDSGESFSRRAYYQGLFV
jgi:hypothetical protein